jgi:hypothetical protein
MNCGEDVDEDDKKCPYCDSDLIGDRCDVPDRDDPYPYYSDEWWIERNEGRQ